MEESQLFDNIEVILINISGGISLGNIIPILGDYFSLSGEFFEGTSSDLRG